MVAISSLISLVSVGAPPLAAADDGKGAPAPSAPDPPSNAPSAEQQARQLQKEAFKALADGRLRDAADLYSKAWDRYKRLDFICNRGMLLLETGLYREAAESLETCMHAPTGAVGSVNIPVNALLLRARKHLCTLNVTTSVDASEVFIENRSLGISPLTSPVYVNPGRYILVAKSNGYEPAMLGVECAQGQWYNVPLTLERPLAPGEVMTAPVPLPKEASLKIGPLGSGGVVATQSVDMYPHPYVPPSPEPQTPARNMGMILAGGVMVLAGAGLATGSFFAASGSTSDADQLANAVSSRDPSKDCNGLSPDSQCVQVESNRKNATMFTALGVGSSLLFVAGATITIYGIVGGGSTSGGVNAGLRVTPQGGSLVMGGIF